MGYLNIPELVETLRTQLTQSDETIGDTSPSNVSEESGTNLVEEETENLSNDTLLPNVVVEESGNSSISRSILTEIKDGKQPAKRYTLDSVIDKAHLFDVMQALQTLSDHADNMSISIKVTATKSEGFDLNWLRNAIEEPLDEQEIKASTRIE